MRPWIPRALLALWAVSALLVVGAFVTPPHDRERASEWQLDAGTAASFQLGRPKLVDSGPEPVWVVRLDGGEFTALSAVCGYQHCVLRWNPELEALTCPCHHGSYGLDGQVVTGPARRALRRFHVNLKSGRVRVHLRRLQGVGA